jgi:nucleoid-associated protein YgaU
MRIFDANKDQLSDPDAIVPGQVLKIPAMDKQLT